MKIISKNRDQLVLQHIPWIPLGLGLPFLLLGIVFSIKMLMSSVPDYFGIFIILIFPVALLVFFCNVTTTTFNKSTKLVSIQYWRLIGSDPIVELPLSNVSDLKITDPKGQNASGKPVSAQIILEADGELYPLSKERSQFFGSEKHQQLLAEIRDFIGLSKSF